VEFKHPAGGRRADVDAVVAEHGRQPDGLSRHLDLIDVGFASARVEDHEPDQPGPHDEPDDEQPPVELGIHRREV
jgi:hypothetical protein